MKTLTRMISFAAVLAALVSVVSAGSPVNLRVELDRPVLPAETRETVIVKVALDGIRNGNTRRPPINLALVIDKSGSMSGERISQARQAAHEAVRRLDRDDLVSLVAFDNLVHVLMPARRVGDGQAIAAAIDRIGVGGMTNLHGGVVEGGQQLRAHIEEGYTHRVILLSDGQANVGPRTPEALGNLGAQLMREGIAVTTIGLGLDFNEDLMTRLARRSDGNTYFVEDGRDLPRIFREELGDVLSIVARRVIVEVDFPAHVRPVRVIGREGRVEERRAVIELNQLYGGQEKFALIEVEVAAGRVGATREIARAQVRYEDAATVRAGSQAQRVSAKYTKREAEVVAAANHQVQADYAANVLAEARDEVVALADAGRTQEAGARMRAASESLATLGAVYGNTVVSSLAAPAAVAAERVATEGLSNAERKLYRAEAQQTYSQQRVE